MKKAVLIDIDNTLVDASVVFRKVLDRTKEEQFNYFYDHVHDCAEIKWCTDLVKLLSSTHSIVFLTGRSAICREATEKQLKDLGFKDYELVMRPAGDNITPDEDMKRMLLKGLTKRYEFTLAIDDREQNCKVYTEEYGIPSLVVYYPVEARY